MHAHCAPTHQPTHPPTRRSRAVHGAAAPSRWMRGCQIFVTRRRNRSDGVRQDVHHVRHGDVALQGHRVLGVHSQQVPRVQPAAWRRHPRVRGGVQLSGEPSDSRRHEWSVLCCCCCCCCLPPSNGRAPRRRPHSAAARVGVWVRVCRCAAVRKYGARARARAVGCASTNTNKKMPAPADLLSKIMRCGGLRRLARAVDSPVVSVCAALATRGFHVAPTPLSRCLPSVCAGILFGTEISVTCVCTCVCVCVCVGLS